MDPEKLNRDHQYTVYGIMRRENSKRAREFYVFYYSHGRVACVRRVSRMKNGQLKIEKRLTGTQGAQFYPDSVVLLGNQIIRLIDRRYNFNLEIVPHDPAEKRRWEVGKVEEHAIETEAREEALRNGSDWIIASGVGPAEIVEILRIGSHINFETIRDWLVQFDDDPSKVIHYGDQDHEVMFNRAWLFSIREKLKAKIEELS